MSHTRDIIEEIAAVRQRRRFGHAMAELPMRLLVLERSFKRPAPKNDELMRYFPVALIAYRTTIKELVDACDPYLTNAERLASSVKIDFSLIKAVLGASFLERIRVANDRWKYEVKGNPLTPILHHPDKVLSDVANTFELRHIICHELASTHGVEHQQVAQCLESCVAFLRAADELVSNTLQPDASLGEARAALTPVVVAFVNVWLAKNWRHSMKRRRRLGSGTLNCGQSSTPCRWTAQCGRLHEPVLKMRWFEVALTNCARIDE